MTTKRNKFLLALLAAYTVNGFGEDELPEKTPRILPAIPQQGPILKTIEVEWEPIPKAGGYEVRFTPKAGGKPLKFITEESKISQDVPIGEYTMQVRSRARDVDYWSPWSEAVPLEVVTREINPLKPEDESTLSAIGLSKYTIDFEWEPVPSVKEYTLKVWNEHRADKPWVFVTRGTKKKLDVPPGEVYYWQVLFESASAVSYQQEPSTFTFTILGMKLTTPEIDPPEPTPNLKRLTWRASQGATMYHAKLYFRYLDEKKWGPPQEFETATTSWEIKQLKRGSYRLDVQATAPKRTPSDLAQMEFLVKPSDNEIRQALVSVRSPASQPAR
jgi:hypothetical protein